MNKLDLQKYRNQVRQLVQGLYIKVNTVNINPSNSIEHEIIKLKICYFLQKEGKQYITEAKVYRTNQATGRADIIVLDDRQIIEIMVSESLDELKFKIRKYPNIEIIAVRSFEEYKSDAYHIIKQELI